MSCRPFTPLPSSQTKARPRGRKLAPHRDGLRCYRGVDLPFYRKRSPRLVYFDIDVPNAGVELFDARFDVVYLFADETRNAVGIVGAKPLERFEVAVHFLVFRAQRLISICLAQKRGTVEFDFA